MCVCLSKAVQTNVTNLLTLVSANAHKPSRTHIIYQIITPMFPLPECTVINGLTLRDVLCVNGWLSPQGTENRPSPCIDLCMSSSYKKILKVLCNAKRLLG